MVSTHYTGKAGHLAVMGEIALRGYNVALPEIDVGDDIFAVNPQTGKLVRVQVKTARGKFGKLTTTYRKLPHRGYTISLTGNLTPTLTLS
jgi:hypothetical protein